MMNQQPHPVVGQFGVLIFALLVAYFSFTGNKKRQSFSFNDQFVIGYINDNQPACSQSINTCPKQSVKKNTKKKIPQSLLTSTETHETNSVIENNQLYDDCVLCLTSLGSKKQQAKNTVKEIFEKHNPSTIEDFIKFVYLK
jgi:hypothetical protein